MTNNGAGSELRRAIIRSATFKRVTLRIKRLDMGQKVAACSPHSRACSIMLRPTRVMSMLTHHVLSSCSSSCLCTNACTGRMQNQRTSICHLP